MTDSHSVRAGEGEIIDLGIATMRLLAPSELSGGGFTLSEFAGAEGPWTVLHVHNHFEESFLVLEGRFTFTSGDDQIEAEPGTYVLVKRGTPHTMTARAEVACYASPFPAVTRRCSASCPGSGLKASEIRKCERKSRDGTTQFLYRSRLRRGERTR